MNGLRLETRLRIHELSKRGQPDRTISGEVKCSLSAVRKWRRRIERDGRAAAQSRLGRPKRGALSGFDARVVRQLRQMRETNPGWGAKTLRVELGQDDELRGLALALPARSSIARWLKAGGYVQRYQRHQALPAVRVEASDPHRMWEMDGRGQEYVPDIGVIQLINVNDVNSRVKLMSYPCELGRRRLERRANQSDYQLTLRLAFCQWGLPDAVSLDHDPVFIDASSKSPFPMQLHLWLVGLGVAVQFIRVGRPTDHGLTERSHQTWQHQVLDGHVFHAWEGLFGALNDRRTFLNESLPCATLGDQPPLVACPQARLPRRPYHPDHEAALIDLQRVYAFLATCRWFRDVRGNGTVSLGNQVYSVGHTLRGQTLEIRFDPSDQHLVFFNAAAESIQRRPIRNLSTSVLMGDLDLLYNTPCLQLRLPFDPDALRVSRLCETLTGMH
jgi:transposase